MLTSRCSRSSPVCATRFRARWCNSSRACLVSSPCMMRSRSDRALPHISPRPAACRLMRKAYSAAIRNWTPSFARYPSRGFERVKEVQHAVKVLISGATGVIGARTIPLLLAAGHEVSALVRSPDRAAQLAGTGVKPVMADLFDASGLRAALSGHEVVSNLASHIPPLDLRAVLPSAWAANGRIRSVGSANLVDAALAARAAKFSQESFALAYPDCGDAWIVEETPLAPVRYNRTVADAERAVARFREHGGFGI